MHVITVTNQKGGVAKTTTAVNLAAGLALLEAHRNPTNPEKVLFISLDPQGDGAQIMGGTFVANGLRTTPPLPQNFPTISNLLVDDEPPAAAKVIQRAVLPASLRGKSNLYYIPITSAEQAAVQNRIVNVEMREQRLDMVLQPLASIYKYVIIDTPPNVGLMTMNALYASNHFIVPMVPNGAGLRFLQDLLKTIAKVQKKYNPGLQLLGILPSKCTMSRSETRLALEELQANFSDGILFAPIIERSDVQYAYSCGLDVFSSKPPRTGTEQFTSEAEGSKEFGRFVTAVFNRLNGSIVV